MFRILLALLFSPLYLLAQPKEEYNLRFDSLAKSWDEGMPLGNGWMGALIWQKGDQFRISLDRVDLWDDRPMPLLSKFNFDWVTQQVIKGSYDTVQKLGDIPYDKSVAPTKIPGAALSFDLSKLGSVISNELDLKNGLNRVVFKNGLVVNNYVHASKNVGYFGFEHLPTGMPATTFMEYIQFKLLPPEYSMPALPQGDVNSLNTVGVQKLGYAKGSFTNSIQSMHFHQPTWNGTYYEVLVQWKVFSDNKIIGQWTIANNEAAVLPPLEFTSKEPTGWESHLAWWNDYWSRSSIHIPDATIEKQYYREMYKFGSVARANTPPISLQAVWTADNGKLPPWKGDYHHDLNTQLSYWPGYSGNHDDLTAGFTNWLWKVKEENKRWTQQYFGFEGLNVPGVTTITGKEMGGWIQYSLSPTTAAWLAQHFYWQWRYTGDTSFLYQKAIPYVNDVATYLEQKLEKDQKQGIILSSSPEYYNNSLQAWFRNYTNYDRALIKYVLGLKKNWMYLYASRFKNIPEEDKRIDALLKWVGNYDVNETGLTVAAGQNLDESHRHHAHLMALHPFGTMNISEPREKEVIEKSLAWLEKTGTRSWCGYSFSWAACLYARAHRADSALRQLQIFASNFCSPNSFHFNGDQKGGQYSNFTYRPFTLEGNFAFAQGVHEMLLQSHQGYLDVFPAVPVSWTNVSFHTLKTEGGFLVSAVKKGGKVNSIRVKATVDGMALIKKPEGHVGFKSSKQHSVVERKDGLLQMQLKKGEEVLLEF